MSVLRAPRALPRTAGPLAIALLVLGAVLAVRIAWAEDFDSFDQAKQGLYVVDAHREGRWLVPLEGGWRYPTKPPLLTWLSLGLAKMQGAVTEFTARAPSLLAAVVTLAATVAFARPLGPLAATAAGIALATNLHFVKGA